MDYILIRLPCNAFGGIIFAITICGGMSMSSVIAGFVVGAVMGTVCFWGGYFCNRFVERIDDLHFGFFSHGRNKRSVTVDKLPAEVLDIAIDSISDTDEDACCCTDSIDDPVAGEHGISPAVIHQIKRTILSV